MVQRRVLQCGLCRSKEKCLKPGLKRVNRWSSSTVQRKRVPESWSSNRETTSSSVQVVRRSAELTEASLWTTAANETDCMGWSDQQGSLAVEKRSPDNKVWQVWNWSAAGLAASAGSVTVVQLMLSEVTYMTFTLTCGSYRWWLHAASSSASQSKTLLCSLRKGWSAVASLGWVTPGAAAEGVTPLFCSWKTWRLF